ncbi:hypothetical protein EYF80_011148 [Liparis tanakae]|uniref:Uncharacterized protein n=1 Tax=Liparis tanakae TaxID=230148 RepID=A0A4Z2IN23_9TELE|nr:hypothetical protein EYF80_011148 [Liparis tanakae]
MSKQFSCAPSSSLTALSLTAGSRGFALRAAGLSAGLSARAPPTHPPLRILMSVNTHGLPLARTPPSLGASGGGEKCADFSGGAARAYREATVYFHGVDVDVLSDECLMLGHKTMGSRCVIDGRTDDVRKRQDNVVFGYRHTVPSGGLACREAAGVINGTLLAVRGTCFRSDTDTEEYGRAHAHAEL